MTTELSTDPAPAQSAAAAQPASIFVVGARGIPDVEGGAEKNAEKLFPLVAAAGYQVTLVGLKDFTRTGEYNGVRLRQAPSSRLFKTDKLLAYLAAVFMAARLKPDIVHFQGLGSALFLWAYKLMGMKTVVRYGSADYLVSKWGWVGKLGFLASEFQLRFADAVIAVTPALAERLRRRGISANVHVVANAVDNADADADMAEAPGGDYVLSVGRVTAQKNVANLIAGFTCFAGETGGSMRLLIAGGLDDEAYVESLRPLLTDRVELAGRLARSKMGPVYAKCRLFVNASIHEGSSNAVLEAISAGCPILVSDIPENRDFGLPDRCYFDPGRPEAIAAAIKAALADPGAYVADPGRFMTWRNVADRTMSIYRTVAPAKLRRSAAAPA